MNDQQYRWVCDRLAQIVSLLTNQDESQDTPQAVSHATPLDAINAELAASFEAAELGRIAEKNNNNIAQQEYWKGELAALHRLRRVVALQAPAPGEKSSTPWVVQTELPDDPEGLRLCLPTMESWGACHSLIHAPDGLGTVTAEWVGFFINKEVAEKVKLLLENGDKAAAPSDCETQGAAHRRLVRYHFVRYRREKVGPMSQQEVWVDVEPHEDPEIEELRSYDALFAQYPEWGTGQPLKDGIGWSSALPNKAPERPQHASADMREKPTPEELPGQSDASAVSIPFTTVLDAVNAYGEASRRLGRLQQCGQFTETDRMQVHEAKCALLQLLNKALKMEP